jgi:hypothetical protein
MDKNRIGGSRDGTSGRETTKSISIKRRGCKSGGRASKAAKPTSGDLGVGKDLAAQTAGSPHGPWRLSRSPALSFALPGAFWERLGLPRLIAR